MPDVYRKIGEEIEGLDGSAFVKVDEPLYRIDVPLNNQIEMVSHLKWAGVLVRVNGADNA